MSQPEVPSYEHWVRQAEHIAATSYTFYDSRGKADTGGAAIAATNRAIAYAILALAAATRPAPVEVRVEVDKAAIVAAVRETLGGDK